MLGGRRWEHEINQIWFLLSELKQSNGNTDKDANTKYTKMYYPKRDECTWLFQIFMPQIEFPLLHPPRPAFLGQKWHYCPFICSESWNYPWSSLSFTSPINHNHALNWILLSKYILWLSTSLQPLSKPSFQVTAFSSSADDRGFLIFLPEIHANIWSTLNNAKVRGAKPSCSRKSEYDFWLPVQFKPRLFQGQLYLHVFLSNLSWPLWLTWSLNNEHVRILLFKKMPLCCFPLSLRSRSKPVSLPRLQWLAGAQWPPQPLLLPRTSFVSFFCYTSQITFSVLSRPPSFTQEHLNKLHPGGETGPLHICCSFPGWI